MTRLKLWSAALVAASIFAVPAMQAQNCKTAVHKKHAKQTETPCDDDLRQQLQQQQQEIDALKAQLFNCARHGPAEQNRDGVPDFKRHLEARVAWVAQVNPWRAEKLWALFDRIQWP